MARAVINIGPNNRPFCRVVGSRSPILAAGSFHSNLKPPWEPTQLLSVLAELSANRWRAPRPSVVDAEMEKVIILYVVLGVIVVAADWMSRD
jgi:hypothetical protein